MKTRRGLIAGTVMEHVVRGRILGKCIVTVEGFEYNGKVYRSLSAAATQNARDIGVKGGVSGWTWFRAAPRKAQKSGVAYGKPERMVQPPPTGDGRDLRQRIAIMEATIAALRADIAALAAHEQIYHPLPFRMHSRAEEGHNGGES